jgi:hypothetical protein
VEGPNGTSEFSNELESEKPATIAGQVFLDANGNGRHDPGESGLNTWTVQLLDDKGNVVRQIQTQNTGLIGDGGYRFDNLLPLYTYTVREVPKAGAQQTSPGAPGVYIDKPLYGEQIAGQDFGNRVAIPTVRSIDVNNGSVQRSMVTTITVTFSTQVNIDPGAFGLQEAEPRPGRARAGDAGNLLNVARVGVVNGQTVVALTFAGVGVFGDPVTAGSLPDGKYTLTINAALVHDAVTDAPLTSGLPGASPGLGQVSYRFFRLFGDANGNGQVDKEDRAAFLRTLGSQRGMANYRPYFDVNGDGLINGIDTREFRRRYGRRVI